MITKLLRRDHFTSRKLFFVLYRMRIRMHKHVYCMYTVSAYVHIRTYVCMYVCIYIRIYTYVQICA